MQFQSNILSNIIIIVFFSRYKFNLKTYILFETERPKLTIIRNGEKISHGFEATGEAQEEMKCQVQRILTPFSLIWFVNDEVYQNEIIESGLHSELKNFTSDVHIAISASTEDITCMVNDTMFHTNSVSVKVSYIKVEGKETYLETTKWLRLCFNLQFI